MTGVTGFGWTNCLRLVSVFAILLLATPTATLGVPTQSVGPPDTTAFREHAVFSAASQPQNNSTVRHENPDDVDDSGDLEQVESWLTGRLAERLTESSIQLSQGEYDLAREHVDEEYRDLLGKYVDVEGETRSDTNRTDEFERAREQQEQLVSAAEEYETTHQEYREAKEAGNTTKARELARRLERISESVNESSGELQRSTHQLSNSTGVDLTQVEQITSEIVENVSAQQREIRATEFVETHLVVRSGTSDVSFTQPLVLQGRLTEADGSAISNRTIRIGIAERIFRTDTNESGRFSLVYRPTVVALNTAELSVRYLPTNESIYLGSASQIGVNITQVDPALTLGRTSSEVAYGERLAASGSVEVDDIGASNVPIAVYLGGAQIGTTRTSTTGAFEFTRDLPASIPAGEQSLRVVVPLKDRALASATAETPVVVQETRTELSIDAAFTGDEEVTVGGVLTTIAGEPLGKQSIRVQVAGRALRTLRTDPAGRYAATFTLSEVEGEALAGDTLTITGMFSDEGTNFGSTRAEITVERPHSGADERTPIERAQEALRSVPLVVVFLGGVGAVGLGLVAVRRWRSITTSTADSATGPPGPQPDSPSNRSTTTVTPAVDLVRHSVANDDPEVAIQLAYGALREQLAAEEDLNPGATHWDVYSSYRRSRQYSAEQVRAVRAVVEAFEQALFASEPVTQETAETVLSAVERVSSVERDT